MIKAMRIFACFSTILAIGCASGPSSESHDSPVGKWTEQWVNSSSETRVARLTIFDERSAKYTGSNNTRIEFYATDDQRTWKAYWIGEGHTSCLQQKGGINSWGESIFHFDETYTRYKGTWDYCGQGRKFSMSGVR